MFLAVKEMARAKVRFALLISAIGMLVFLILFQQSIQSGLVTSFVGAIRNQSAPVLVYSVDGQRVIQASAITPELDELVRTVDGLDGSGRIGQRTFSVTVGTDGGDTGELTEAALIGYDDVALGGPTTLIEGRLPAGPGEAVASEADAGHGFGLGETVTVEPGGLAIEVVGLARDAQLSASPTLFVVYDTYVAAVRAANPDAGDPVPNVLAVAPVDGVGAGELADRINERSDELDALPRAQAADETPGVAQVRQSFQVIFLLYALVIPCVTGLFFLILTFQKSGALTLLRAIGAPAGRLVTALVVQASLIVGAGFLVGVAGYYPISQLRVGGIQLQFEPSAVAFWAVVLAVLGVGSSLLSARRVLRIDPIEATTGGANR